MVKNTFQLIFMILIISTPIIAGDYLETVTEAAQAKAKNAPLMADLEQHQIPIIESNKCSCKIKCRHLAGLLATAVATGIVFCLVDGPMHIVGAQNDPNFTAFHNSVPQCYAVRDCAIVPDQDCFDLMDRYGRGLGETIIGSTVGGTIAFMGALYYIMGAVEKYCPCRKR